MTTTPEPDHDASCTQPVPAPPEHPDPDTFTAYGIDGEPGPTQHDDTEA